MARLEISLKGRALRYLSMREHSRLELARKLAPHVRETDDLDALLDALEASKLLSQTRFSESLVHRRADRFGNSRIFSELKSHGIDDESLTAIKADLVANERARAREVWRRKFGTPPQNAEQRAKQSRFLQQRGFSSAAISAVMRNLEHADGLD